MTENTKKSGGGELHKLHTGKYLSLCERNGWEFVNRRYGVVMIVAITDDDELLLVEQYREPLQAVVIELPAGLVGDDGDAAEGPELAAQRELEEETGYRAGQMQRLLLAASSPGMANEKIHILRALQLRKVSEGGGVPGENITVHAVKRADVPRWLIAQHARGAVIDSRVYAALSLASLTSDELPGW